MGGGCAGAGLRGSLDCKQEGGGIYMIDPRKHSSYYTIASVATLPGPRRAGP
jgi:hypothetical protein